jgi:ATPase subunit of ABC transporter with duplicated ATPase domains
LDFHEIRLFTGNYDDFTIASLEARELQEKQNQKVERQANDLKAFIARFSSNASKAKQATSRKKTLDKLEIKKIKASSRVSPFIRFKPKKRLGDKVIEAVSVSKSYDQTLFSNFSCTIGPEERVAIVGKNGIGKTTLLNILCKQLESDTGQVLFGETVQISLFPQDASSLLNAETPALEWLSRFSDAGTAEVELRSFMGKMLFKGQDVLKKTGVLSGGEKARLIISKMLLEGGNVLALDEPTNHLDLESIEELNYGLSLFPHTLIFVSHDHRFIATLATRILEVTKNGITDYRGTLDEFEAWKKAQKAK